MAGIAELIAARIPKSNSLADALKRKNEVGDYMKSRDDASAMEAAIRAGDDAAVMRLPGGAEHMKKVYDARATAENVPLRRAQTGQALAAADRSTAAGEKDMQATKAAKHAEWGNRLYAAAQDPAFNGQIANGFLKEAVDSLGMSYSQAGQLQESLRGAPVDKIRAAALQIAKGTLDMTKQQAMGEISATAVAPKVKTVNSGDAQVGIDENPRSPTFGKQLIRTQINTSPDARLRAQTAERMPEIRAEAKPASSASTKPMPPSVVKLQDSLLADIDVANNNAAIASNIVSKVASGKVDLGPLKNAMAKAKTWAGISDEAARSYGGIVADIAKFRNDSLRLNKGTQTEGDAVRAFDEIAVNLNDSKFVAERLAFISRLNASAADAMKRRVTTIRNEYGKGEIPSPSGSDTPAPGGIKFLGFE